MSEDGYLKRREALWLEKLTYRPRHGVISVSRHALDDFDRHVGVKGKAHVLTNFVNPNFVGEPRNPATAGILRLVAVGNLKSVKNHKYLVEALQGISDVQLDIFGEGPQRDTLQRQITSGDASVRLMGVREDMWNVLADYDVFVMPSLYEGCPNAAIEAMAAGLPLLLSNIPVMREVSHGNALFFDLDDPRSLAAIVKKIIGGEIDLKAMSERGCAIVEANYRKSRYLERLNAVYAEAVASGRKPSDAPPE
jgi:glycosyltransferase involved in cell wall biosynthesis